MAILVLNPGSTTLKAAVISTDGSIKSQRTIETWDLGEAARTILQELDPEVTAIGCRVVHGGRQFTEPIQVTPEIAHSVEVLGELAPLHNYGAAAVLRTCLEMVPHIPVIAVFDTAFHATLPTVARTYALPHTLTEQEGLYRYGFQGIAHQATSVALTALLEGENRSSHRLVTCHLGGGASLCAVRDGMSVDTTMGLTPMEGLMMATRSGDLDPGILLHLLSQGWDKEGLQHLLNQESGLLGVSGLSTDPRVLLRAGSEGNEHAKLALELYTYRIAKGIAAMTVPLGGLEGISFSGGIGQNSAAVREQICQHLEHLGVQLDQSANYSGESHEPIRIHATESRVGVWAIPSAEELVIAKIVVSRTK